MHITRNDEKNSNLLLDHSLIGSEIEKSIKNYNCDYIFNELPEGSFLVGGYIRDLIIGKNKRRSDIDIDIIIPQNAYKVGKNIAQKYNGKLIILDKDRQIIRIIIQGLTIDIASQISESFIEDIFSRDFTINSITFSLDSKLIFDPLNGIGDINKSLLRTYQTSNLIDDPLRILRCFRFVSEFDFNIDKDLFSFIKLNKNKLASVSVERLQYEFRKIIRGKNALKSILLINETNLFSWLQSQPVSSQNYLHNLNLKHFYIDEIYKFMPIFFLIETLNEVSIRNLKFSKSETTEASALRKWKNKMIQGSINEFDDCERFQLHKELEEILPAFILYLPEKDQLDWLKRWRDNEDKLFHPTNLLNGDTIKKHININDGPLLGQLLDFISMELAYERLQSLDDAIYKAKQWFQQNAPKYD
tara:strand:- start:12583 stop:13830 length:1248 start_codon:yes stop_codon:yes gene_type:complete